MNNVNQDFNKFTKAVGAKVNAAKADLLKSGNRNVKGLQFSMDRIIKSSENLFFQQGRSFDPVQALYKGFSENVALANTGNIAGVDVVDINIAATNKSVLGYLCAERGLEDPISTLWFQGLKAMAERNQYKKGAWINKPYQPMDNAIVKALKGATVKSTIEGGTVDLAKMAPDAELLMKTLKVFDGEGKVIGKYIDGDILFNDGRSSATINETGIITFTGNNAASIAVDIDKTTERSGAHTLKVKPANQSVQITAEPRRIHLEQS